MNHIADGEAIQLRQTGWLRRRPRGGMLSGLAGVVGMRNVAAFVWVVGCAPSPVAPRFDDAGADRVVDVRPAPNDQVVIDQSPPPDVPPVGIPDDARVVRSIYPQWMIPGETGRIHVTMANVGTATWTTESGYRLGAVGDSDPVAESTRIDVAGPVMGSPSTPGVFTFDIYIHAPTDIGSYASDWQMVHDGVGWFGPVTNGNVEVRADLALCPAPAPPPVDRFNVAPLHDMGWRKVLDSTPQVYGGDYCTSVGFVARLHCPPRPEGTDPAIIDACNDQAVGRAADTGRIGPTWTFNDLPCLDDSVDGRCRNHNDNQFLVFVFGNGTARACGRNGVCGELAVTGPPPP